MIYRITFTRSDLIGEIVTPYVGKEGGAKTYATRIYRERFTGPWVARVWELPSERLVASRIGFSAWRNAQ